MAAKRSNAILPTAEQIRQAVGLYLKHTYGRQLPQQVLEFLPAGDFSCKEFLMSGKVERSPQSTKFPDVRSFYLRLGSADYPHMKLRIARSPKDNIFLFSVDCHDAFLQAPSGSSEKKALAKLKDCNARIAKKVESAWDQVGLPTHQAFLRQKIAQAKRSSPG